MDGYDEQSAAIAAMEAELQRWTEEPGDGTTILRLEEPVGFGTSEEPVEQLVVKKALGKHVRKLVSAGEGGANAALFHVAAELIGQPLAFIDRMAAADAQRLVAVVSGKLEPGPRGGGT